MTHDAARSRAVEAGKVASRSRQGANALGDHVTGTVTRRRCRAATREQRRSAIGGAPRSPASAPPSSPRTPGRSELQLAVRGRHWPRSTTPGSQPSDVDGMVTFTMDDQPRDRGRPQPRHRRPQAVQPHPLRRRRRRRHDPAGGDGRRDRRRPTSSSATARSTSARATASAPACRTARREPNAEAAHFAWYVAVRPGHARRSGWPCSPGATCTTFGATSEDFGRVAVADRLHAATNPEGLVLRAADHARGPPDSRAGSSSRCTCSTAARRATAGRRSSSRRSSAPATCRSRRRSSPPPRRAASKVSR